MFNNIIRHLSESIKQYTYNTTEKTRTRQLNAVACVLIIFILYIGINVYRSEAKPIEKEDNIIQTISNEEVLSEQDVNNKMQVIQVPVEPVEIKEPIIKEPTEEIIEEETRENTLYYIEDEGYTFYLDNEYQDYLWNKLKEYDHTDFYETCIAMMYHESRFEPDTVSETHDHGLMQINAGNYTWLRDTLNIESLDNPYDNIDCGVYMLISNYDKYGDIEQALVAYHQGSVGSAKSTQYSRCILQHDIELLKILNE